MRFVAVTLLCALASSACGSANDSARLFGRGEGADAAVPSSGGRGGGAGCEGASCGGASCVNGQGPGCPMTSTTPPCAPSQKDCAGRCVDPSPANGCGDTACTPCPEIQNGHAACRGEDCGFDCDPGYVANGNSCDAPPPGCTDGVKNGSETDVDCGGTCPRCSSGKGCNIGADCLTAACLNGECSTASCTNGVQDSNETDIDCGGENCPRCPVGGRCKVGSDCAAQSCESGICRASSCGDQTKNGSETGIDCGGACPPCSLNDTCKVDADCVTMHCVQGYCRQACKEPNQSAGCPKCSGPLGGTACCRADQYCGCALQALSTCI